MQAEVKHTADTDPVQDELSATNRRVRWWLIGALVAMTLVSVPLAVLKREAWGAWGTAPFAVTMLYAIALPFIASYFDGWRDVRDFWRRMHPSHGILSEMAMSKDHLKAMVAIVLVAPLLGLGVIWTADPVDRAFGLFLIALGLTSVFLDMPRIWLFKRHGNHAPLNKVAGWLILGTIGTVATVGCLLAWGLRSFTLDPSDQVLFIGAVAGLPGISVISHWIRFRITATWQKRVEAETLRANVAEQAREIAEMQLSILQAQIEPHFLYNTLASVQYLIPRDAGTAIHLLGQLIIYLQQAMPQMREKRSTLGREMRLALAYLEIARIRMGGRLSVRLELPAELESCELPPLLLHTLVENALKHGVEPKAGRVRIRLGAHRTGDSVVVWVEDNGVGLGGAATSGSGTGLRNIRQRLHTLYGDAGLLRVESAPESGVRSELQVPIRVAEESERQFEDLLSAHEIRRIGHPTKS